MSRTSSRWIAPLVAATLCVPVATAQGHPADSMYLPGAEYGANAGGVGVFMQREAETPGLLTQLGHEPLLGRGMNAAIAVHKGHVYIGSRTDGKNNNANHAGVMIVDAKDPTNPHIVHEIGPPFEGNPGESSRELRVWRSQEILIVLHTNCGGATAHVCSISNRSGMRFYDISGEYATNPRLLWQDTRDTHEFFVWEDPNDPRRAFMFAASAGSQFQIYNLSPLLNPTPGQPQQVFSGAHGFGNSSGSGIHSFSVSNDGTRAYFALLTRGFGVANVSAFTDTNPATNTYSIVTPQANRVSWPGPGAHSAVKLWNKDWVYVSDEVYGTATANGHGCPWGWTRFVDIANPVQPVVRSEFRLAENSPLICPPGDPTGFNPPRTSYSAHNPTLTPNIAFSTWHSGGFQAMDISDPASPTQLAEFKPEPLSTVEYPNLLEDPRLSSDGAPYLPGRTDNKVVMWSYPVIEDGLIYTVDLRNGLYILKYDGPHEKEVDDITFLEGNSNQGDALCYEPVGDPPAFCPAAVDTQGEVSATVPATLSLSLGAPANFGAFTPGVAQDYLASTTANVISSAGDALLSVADPSSTATGHLVNGTFSLPTKVQARGLNAANPASVFADVGSSASPTPLLTYTGPVSNDAVSLEFKQAIGATDALRTGPYSKTFTFTLSTTSP